MDRRTWELPTLPRVGGWTAAAIRSPAWSGVFDPWHAVGGRALLWAGGGEPVARIFVRMGYFMGDAAGWSRMWMGFPICDRGGWTVSCPSICSTAGSSGGRILTSLRMRHSRSGCSRRNRSTWCCGSSRTRRTIRGVAVSSDSDDGARGGWGADRAVSRRRCAGNVLAFVYVGDGGHGDGPTNCACNWPRSPPQSPRITAPVRPRPPFGMTCDCVQKSATTEKQGVSHMLFKPNESVKGVLLLDFLKWAGRSDDDC